MSKMLTIASLCLSISLAATAHADGWATYKAEKFGFSMLVPEGTKFTEKELSGGWGALVATAGPLSVFAIGKLGEAATPEEIQKFGVTVTGMGADHWKVVDDGKDSKGWKWHRSVKAEHEGGVVFGGYGVGPKGNYLMLIKTTAADFEKHSADYLKWYASITVE